jgi:hypothetical protein
VATGEAIRGQTLTRPAVRTRTGVASWSQHLGRRILIYGAAILLTIWTLIPIYWIVNISLMF